MEVLKIASTSNPNAVARALTGALETSPIVEAHAIGAGAVNQAAKAVAIARRDVEREGRDLVMTPGFIEIEIDDRERTAMRFFVEYRPS